ncbi:MAG: C45 family autoproteolytic acyltransferase/hydrolase [Kiloniellales bacterium]|nr:C45 family autoproteolytic acyltransferase/hydrolase [Kiloniellales bacterium]
MSFRHVEDRPTPADCRADSRLQVWECAGKPFFLLAQKGRFPDICYDHGRLLASEIEDGVFPEILATIAHDVDADPGLKAGLADKIQGAFFNRVCRDLLRSTSDEFRRGVEALERGCFASRPNSIFDRDAVEHACVSIDAGNIASGFTHLRKHRRLSVLYGYWRNYVTNAWVLNRWGRRYADSGEGNVHDDVPLAEWLDGAPSAGRLQPAGMGCTGFWAAPGLTEDGLGLHARNFDGGYFAWNDYPVLGLIDETPENPAWQRYAAVGTAGLVYSGGISGLNEAGIAASLHQMSTVNFTVGDGSGDFDLAPYVQQRILREARTLDEAVDIARGRKHFASWTILVSHAPSGKALRIEMNGSEDDRGAQSQKVEAAPEAERMIQTNHFLSDALRERNKFFDDAHFTKTVGKWMETRARFATAGAKLDQAVDQGALGTRRALEILADHDDHAAGGERRSFGRTICKAYSLMTSIARTSADRAAPADQIWFTVGDRLPGPHATLAGFAIDWAGLSVTPLDSHVAETVPPGMLAAMEAYVEAFAAYFRPREPDGAYFRRRPTATEMQNIRQVALAALDRAVEGAESTGIVEPTFRYIRARLCHETALAEPATNRPELLQRAARDWAWLRQLDRDGAVTMTDWERALVYTLSAVTEIARDQQARATFESLLETGRGYLEKVARESFGTDGLHQDIKTWRKVAAAIEADEADAALPDIDFVTVE